jgi:hypothetical protein
MTTSRFLDGLDAEVTAAAARVRSAFANLRVERDRVGSRFDEIAERLGRATAARDRVTDSELHARVMEAFRTGAFGELSFREQRYAARRFESVTSQGMQEFLATYPGHWQTFVHECFRRWDLLLNGADPAGYARLLCLAPASVRLLHQGGRIQEIASASGPSVVAERLGVTTLALVRQALERAGWDVSWAFTSMAVATWTWMRSSIGASFDELWSPVTKDLVLEAMLLPPLRNTSKSWFSDQQRPGRVRPTTYGQALFISSLLRGASNRRARPEYANQFTDGLLRSEFGDPRIPPESRGWLELKRVDPELYRRFLEILISEDLEIFFDYAMEDPRRRQFWLGYLSSVRRTACILDGSTYDRIKAQLGGADKKLSGALARARRFKSRGGSASAQAFCLYFDNVVIVEFSETGNAAYVYRRDLFEEKFEAAVQRNLLKDHHKLKDQRSKLDRIIHNHARWEEDTRDALSRFGIFPKYR